MHEKLGQRRLLHPHALETGMTDFSFPYALLFPEAKSPRRELFPLNCRSSRTNIPRTFAPKVKKNVLFYSPKTVTTDLTATDLTQQDQPKLTCNKQPRASVLTRDIDIAMPVCASVRLSVRHVTILYRNGNTLQQFLHHTVRSSSTNIKHLREILTGSSYALSS